MYAYSLYENPYPSSPTPTKEQSQVLGGTLHQQAKDSIIHCIRQLYNHISSKGATEEDFRLITLIQDVGCGKTHLALHIKNIPQSKTNLIVSYLDLSTVSPKTSNGVFEGIFSGIDPTIFAELRKSLYDFILDKAEGGDQHAKKVLNYTLKDRMFGTTLRQKLEEILEGNSTPSMRSIDIFLNNHFEKYESNLAKGIVCNNLGSIENLKDLIGMINAFSKLCNRFINKISLFVFDEFDGSEESIDITKAIINSHVASAVLLLITTPAGYARVQKTSPSIFDRLEKANHKIDLAGSNSLSEITEIAMEYIRHSDHTVSFGQEEQDELIQKIKVIYEEFPDFRNIRSIINILYQSMELSKEKNIPRITDDILDESIRRIYPGIKIQGSILQVPITDFIKIRRTFNGEFNKQDIRYALSNLIEFAYSYGTISEPHTNNNSLLDAVYNDPAGKRIGIAAVINNDHRQNFDDASKIYKSCHDVDKLILLTNSKIKSSQKLSVVNVDKSKVIDLLYFNKQYQNNESINEKVHDLVKEICIA